MKTYVNVYLQDRSYGGPEEGGWWYDTRAPLARCEVKHAWTDGKLPPKSRASYEDVDLSHPELGQFFATHPSSFDPASMPDKLKVTIPLASFRYSERTERILLRWAERENRGRRPTWSVDSDGRIVVLIEPHGPRAWPEYTPHYE